MKKSEREREGQRQKEPTKNICEEREKKRQQGRENEWKTRMRESKKKK